MKIVLGIETSCDETSVAVLETPKKILSNVVASQDAIHSAFGGVVPELASRRHMEMIVPLTQSAMKEAGVDLKDLSAVAVTRAPGLIGSLLVGVSFAKAIAFAHSKPLVGVNHLEGHLNAAFLEHENTSYPHIGLVVSGGHTSLYLVKGFGKYKLLGATRDDAAGEAFDKVAKLLGMGYPGGPIIDKLSEKGNPKAFKFTKPKMNKGTAFDVGELDFSFSGLKTAVMQICKDMGVHRTGPASQDLAASFQHTVIEIITSQCLKACKLHRCKALVVSGGVAANRGLRSKLGDVCKEEGVDLFLPSMKFCTDNAAMIAYVGGKKFEKGYLDDMLMKVVANEEIGK